MEWLKSLNEAIDYMENNITREITCEEIAKHVYFSNFHFQRTFSALTGMTMGEYLRNRRLSLAGQELLKDNNKVIDIALKYGYHTSESFSKAFSRFHGVIPSQVKKEGTVLQSFNRLIIKIKIEGGRSIAYKIVNKEAFQVAAMTRLFDSENAKTEIPKFWNEYAKLGLHSKVIGMLGICYEEMSYAKEWKYGIGCEVGFINEIPKNFEILEIPANTWAIFTCSGPMPYTIQEMWKRIYSEWLPVSNYDLIQDFDIEYYSEGDTAGNEYISEIWIPVKEK